MTFNQLNIASKPLLLAGVCLILFAPPGVGKTDWANAQPARMTALTGEEWGYTEMFLPVQNPTGLSGYVIPERDKKGRVVSEYSIPIWMQCRDLNTKRLNGKYAWDYKYGICLIEEYGQSLEDIKRMCGELKLKGNIGTHFLPPGWIVIVCSNRAIDRSGVTKDFDFLINRRLEINITPDMKSWEEWAIRHGIHPMFVTFAVQNPQIVFQSKVPDKQGPWCTPRSLCLLERELAGFYDGNGDLPISDQTLGPIITEICHGQVGAAAAQQLMVTVKLGQDLPSYVEIINNPKTCKVPSDPGAAMLICYQLAARVADKEITPVIDYVERLPKEFAVTFTKAAVARDTSLINTKRMGDWCANNATLLAALQSVKAASSNFVR